MDKKIEKKWYMDLDPEIVIKNLLFFFSYCLILVLLVNYLILPSIKEYKLAVMEEKKQKIVYNAILKNFNTAQGNLSLMKQKNKQALETLQKDVTSESIKAFLEKYFLEVVIKNQQSREIAQKHFLETNFEVEAKAKDLGAIQVFFGALEQAPMNLKISIPFVIQKQNKGLFVAFVLKHKKNTYKVLQ